MSLPSRLLESIIDMPGEFADVAAQGPAEALLVLFGAIFVIAPTAYFGYLATGAILSLFLPESFGAEHPEN
ncbi:hypothetical protein GRX03_10400 [Halovenus sp. WSH3]|uniref:Uncharacterized protein n=1 Tax=Halovenus carboxidivorans TaxID=2692199 RepID=A0A6B0T4X0_9EURY|nr:hypothetical protein [Halovenus carboxidivorans]MXR52007.1 hypothetical protein [Halovenus carboxidivorans]